MEYGGFRLTSRYPFLLKQPSIGWNVPVVRHQRRTMIVRSYKCHDGTLRLQNHVSYKVWHHLIFWSKQGLSYKLLSQRFQHRDFLVVSLLIRLLPQQHPSYHYRRPRRYMNRIRHPTCHKSFGIPSMIHFWTMTRVVLLLHPRLLTSGTMRALRRLILDVLRLLDGT